ncbi:hypothetical protein IFVP5_C2280282 [Vibrio parahaemolyticus]
MATAHQPSSCLATDTSSRLVVRSWRTLADFLPLIEDVLAPRAYGKCFARGSISRKGDLNVLPEFGW